MEDYNPFGGTPRVDFDAINKKNEELKQTPKPVTAPAVAEAPEPAGDYSPFGANPFAQAPSASAVPPLSTPAGSQFGLASPPGGSRSAGSPGGYGGQSSPGRQSPPAYGQPMGGASSGAYGQPPSAPSYGQPASGYGSPAPMGGARIGLDGQPIPGTSSYAPQPAAAPYGAPPPAYGAAQPYGAPASPYGAASGTWPPPAMSGPGAYVEQNTSGMGTHIPPEIDRLKWAWGPFFFGWIWARAHNLGSIAWILFGLNIASGIPFLGILAGIANFCVNIWLCIVGSKLAWQNRHFNGGVDEFKKVQRIWTAWGLGFALIGGGAGLYAVVNDHSSSGSGAYSSGGGGSYTPAYGGASGDGTESDSGGAPSGSGAPSGDSGSAGAYGIGGDSGGSKGADEPDAPIGFHPKD